MKDYYTLYKAGLFDVFIDTIRDDDRDMFNVKAVNKAISDAAHKVEKGSYSLMDILASIRNNVPRNFPGWGTSGSYNIAIGYEAGYSTNDTIYIGAPFKSI